MKKFVLSLIPMLVIALAPAILTAQDSMSKQDNMAKGKVSATGCLMKGDTANGYYLKGDNGTTYELWGYKDLGSHVNHKVTVSGMEQKMTDAKEKDKEMNEKKEAGGGPQTDLKVSHVKMVSESCS